MPDFRSILQDIKKRNFSPVYILMGEEPYYIDKIGEALEATVVAEEDKEFDSSIIYGADTNALMIMEAASQFPMMSERRLVMVKEAQSMHTAKNQLDKLSGMVSNPNPNAVVCIIYKGDKLNATSEIIKAAKKNNQVTVFESPKIKENKLPEIVRDFCFSEKIKIEERAIELLVSKVGASLSNLFSDIGKLRVALKPGEDKITADMVADNIGISKEFNNFELKSALARRDYYQSLLIVKYFEENPNANPVQPLMAIIFKFYQELLIAAFNADQSTPALMSALKYKNEWALRDIRTGLQFYNARQLVQAIHALRDFDIRSKGVGSFQKTFPLLRELVCRLITL